MKSIDSFSLVASEAGARATQALFAGFSSAKDYEFFYFEFCLPSGARYRLVCVLYQPSKTLILDDIPTARYRENHHTE